MPDTAVLLVGHGSRLDGAQNALVELAGKLANLSGRRIDYAYMQFAEPTIMQALAKLASSTPRQVVLLPVFIYNGQHVTKDLPSVLEDVRAKYEGVSFLIGEPLGADHRLAEILNERLASIGENNRLGSEISRVSFKTIEAAVKLPADPLERAIAARVVHSAGDRALGLSLKFSTNAVGAGIGALRRGAAIITDVEMVRVGIDHRSLTWGNQVVSGLSMVEESWAAIGTTRTAAGIARCLAAHPEAIIAVGNAPTALNEVCRLIDQGSIKPPLVVGVPVGFVGAVESKDRLMKAGADYISMPGTRGGSPIAAAIVNALVGLATDE